MARRASKDEGSYNPFDSDEDFQKKSSLPAKGKAYVNPFDEHFHRNSISRRAQKGFQMTQGRNPFSEEEEEKPLPPKPSNGNFKALKEIQAPELNESQSC